MKINKNIKLFFNYFLGPLLFAWLGWSIYRQIAQQPGLRDSWQHITSSFHSSAIFLFLGAILLMCANWGLEAYKWMLAIRQIQPLSFATACKAVLAGISISLSTPNRIGEYFGRILYIEEGRRIRAASLTVACNISQLLITLFMGLAALYCLRRPLVSSGFLTPLTFKVAWCITVVACLATALLYFRISWLVKWIDKLPGNKFSWATEAIEHFNTPLLLRFLAISCIRYGIFISQYYLLFRFFGVDVNLWQTWMPVSVMFLILAIIPTIALFTDLGLRNEVSIKLLGIFSGNHLGVSFTSVSIWFINLIIPAIAGSLFILSIKKIFKNKDEVY